MKYSLSDIVNGAIITTTLVALNIVFFIFTALPTEISSLIYKAGVLDPVLVIGGEYNRLLSACFLHSSPMHIFSNMILLLYCGAIVEKNIGHFAFAFSYLACAVAGNSATIFYEYLHREFWMSIGASGAVFGVMGIMLIILIKMRNSLKGASLLRRAAFMVLYSLVMGFSSSMVNNVAHVAGLICGIAIAYAVTAGKRSFYIPEL